MASYITDLAPWERRNQYYNIVQLGKNVKEQANTINTQTKAMIASQLTSANAIIASQERIVEGIDAVALGVNRVEQGIYELKSTFEWGISEVVWQIEQNRAVLKNILEVLMAPLDTQAKERRKRAEEAYTNGWIEDAEEEFLESEKLNKFDFSIHISLGIIYLFHKIDKQKSLSYFEKAIKYSKPKSSFHTSYALLHKALIHFDMGNTEEAEKASVEAINLSPNFTEALYQNAQYNAQLLNNNKSIAHLEKAIRADKLYCLKANKDKLFDPIRNSVNSLFERLRDEEKKKADNSFKKLSEKHNVSKPIIFNLSKENFTEASRWMIASNKLDNELKNLLSKICRDSYFDYLDINKKTAPDIQKKQDDLISDLKKEIEYIIYHSQSGIKNAESEHKNKTKDYIGKTGRTILIGSFIVPAITTLIFAPGADKLWSIAFCVPVFSQLMSIGYLWMFFSGEIRTGNEKIVPWSIIIYIIFSFLFFLIKQVESKDELKTIIKKENGVFEKASPYLDKIKNL
jgi:tetratricopeptide (TPR) repeat protein